MKSLTVVCANMLGCASGRTWRSRWNKEEELRLERVAGAVLVEAGEERVLAGLLEQQLGAGALGEQARERRLADADRPFDRDVAKARERAVFAHRPRKTK
jgi:predicted dienelactone hydrolase